VHCLNLLRYTILATYRTRQTTRKAQSKRTPKSAAIKAK
jgi:hypothetical protein